MKVRRPKGPPAEHSLLLALETSGADLGVALAHLEDGGLAASYLAVARAGAAHRLVGLIDFLLSELEAGKEAVGAVAVDVGPGSFTGLRVGCVVAKTLARELGVPLLAVPSPVARAQAHMQGPLALDWPAVVLQDARRGNVYGAVYAGADAVEGAGGAPWLELVAPTLAPAGDFLSETAKLLAGAPALLCCEEELLRALGEMANVIPAGWEFLPGGDAHRLTAESVAAVGGRMLASGWHADPIALEPLYVAAHGAKRPAVQQPE